jgi:hypothetical protein
MDREEKGSRREEGRGKSERKFVSEIFTLKYCFLNPNIILGNEYR